MKFPQFWLSHNALSKFFSPVAALYGGLLRLRQAAYGSGLCKSSLVPATVVVVGNVIAGGAGKTPIAIALVKRLQSQGYQVGIVSRGYGRKSKACQEVTKASTAAEVGDEPVLMLHAAQVPVFVANSRVAAAKALLAQYPNTQVIVSDDGLQHHALARDIEVVVFDERTTGNGLLLPAGPLREPWPRQPRCSAHLVLSEVVRSLGDYVINGKGETFALAQLKGKRIHALAAVAKPDLFFQMLGDKLQASGQTLTSTQALSDHDPLTNCPLPSGLDNATEALLCTAKDAVKLWQRTPHAMAVPLLIELNHAFLKAFDASVKASVDHKRLK